MTRSGTKSRQPPRAYWFQRHAGLTITAVALLGSIAAILIAELVTRRIHPEWAPGRAERADFWTYDALLGWSHKPGAKGRFHHRDFTVDVSINSHGLRDTEYAWEKGDRRRMIVLGDSYGWGFGVEQQECFSEILEADHPDWEIINASVSGYGTDQEYLYLRERGIRYEPDVVLLLFYENDLINNIRKEQYWYFKPYFEVDDEGLLQLRNNPVPPATLRQRLDRFLLGRTYLGKRIYMSGLRDKLMSWEEESKTSAEAGGGKSHGNVSGDLLRAIAGFCAENGVRFVLVSVPVDWRTGFRKSGEAGAKFLRTVAERNGIPYLALDDAFGRERERYMHEHDRHWNALGHEVAARAIDEYLVELGIF